jgi:cellulose biosynthesis protein BcsQ
VLLQKRGQKVLGIDLDPQSSLTTSVIGGYGKGTFLDVFEGGMTINQVIDKSSYLDIVPSNRQLSELNEELIKYHLLEKEDPLYFLASEIEKISGYDYIMFDTSGTFDRVAKSVIATTDIFVIPFQLREYALNSIAEYIRFCKEFRKENDLKEVKYYVVPNFYNKGRTICSEILQQARKFFYEQSDVIILEACVKETILFENSLVYDNKPLTLKSRFDKEEQKTINGLIDVMEAIFNVKS